MRGLSRVVLIFPLALVLVTVAAVADSMRCGSYIVSDGDSQSRVLDLCGEPRRAWQDGFIEQVVRRNDGYYDPSATPQPYPRLSGQETETRRLIPVYKWEYNLGRGTFLKTLVFQGDILARIIDGPRQ
ncbi:MAG: DUF2845 domain-containing protein [Candidatus Competibacteraceae bacterium]|nr:DUF2845 domain-containing protein [Candidatus Competibacteraceae bacterium]